MAKKDVLPFAAATQLVMLLVLSWSTASHLAWSGPKEGALSAAGLPSRVVKGEELQDLLPMEPLWDILLPLISLAVGTSLGALGMQITLGMTFVQPLLLLLLPSFLTVLESFHERLLAWHLGGIFGQPMLVAQVAIAHAERQEDAGCLKAFGVLVGIYTLGAVLGGLIRSLLQMLLWPFAHQACAQLLILFLVIGNLMSIRHNSHMLGHHEEHQPLLSEHKNLKALKERCSEFLLSEVQRALRSFSSCSRHLAARAALLLGLTCIMGPAPLPALDLLTFTLHPSRASGALAVFWFDLVGSMSYAFLVPMLDILGDPARRLRGLDLFYYPCFGCLMLAFFAAIFHFTTAMKVSVTAGLFLSSCCAVVSAVLTADMSEKAPHLADVGVRLAWGLLCGSMAQYIGANLGQALFLWNSWSAVCGFASICVLLARCWTREALTSS